MLRVLRLLATLLTLRVLMLLATLRTLRTLLTDRDILLLDVPDWLGEDRGVQGSDGGGRVPDADCKRIEGMGSDPLSNPARLGEQELPGVLGQDRGVLGQDRGVLGHDLGELGSDRVVCGKRGLLTFAD